MGKVSRYWQWVRVDAAGDSKVDAVLSAKTFVQWQFSELIDEQDQVRDLALQTQLLKQLQSPAQAPEETTGPALAQLCLCCFISHVLEQIGQQLILQFGQTHGLTSGALRPLLLTARSTPTSVPGDPETCQQDDIRSPDLTDRILQTFPPQPGALSAWVIYQVKHDPRINALLLDHGLYRVSDWTLLNNVTVPQVEQILTQFHHLTAADIRQANQLLGSYHTICRPAQRGEHQSAASSSAAPSVDQLDQIAQALLATSPHPKFTTVEPASMRILNQLQQLALQLRHYFRSTEDASTRIKLMTSLPAKSEVPDFEPADQTSVSEQPTNPWIPNDRQLQQSLDQAIVKGIRARIDELQHHHPGQDQLFVKLMQWYCQGQTLAEIATKVKGSTPYQISQMLRWTDLQADIRHWVLVDWRDRNWVLASDPESLQHLDAELDRRFNRPCSSSSTQKGEQTMATEPVGRLGIGPSLYVQHLCHYLAQHDLDPWRER